ncbi:MAG: PIG-L family deacetylase [Microthrixaceae bacterium]|nr:PIG-L family deacetylase [Microthrixaceae bacterium]
MPARGDDTVVFVHAHPDDEAIFTGGTLAALNDAGVRTVVVLATSGELGERDGAESIESLRHRRRIEAQEACDLLGVARLVFLDHVDSGLHLPASAGDTGSFVEASLDLVGEQIAEVLDQERASAVVGYDDHGIYEHPDHIHAHRATMLAAELAGVSCRYLSTVDREYLHFVESHLIHRADESIPSMRPIGSSTVEITTTIPIHRFLAEKQAAIAAHRSQISDPSLGLQGSFGEVYGYEWYVRMGPRSVLDHLVARLQGAAARE